MTLLASLVAKALALPRWLLAAVCGGLLLCALVWWADRAFTRRLTRAERAGAARVQVDAALRVAHADARRLAAEHALRDARRTVDTVWRRTAARIDTVRATVSIIPDSIRRKFPVVDSALRACTALAQDCAAFRVAAMTERRASDSVHAVDTATIRAQAIVLRTTSDSVRTLAKRPTRTAAAVVGLVLTGVGFVLGASK